MKDSAEFRGEMFWIYYGAEIVILTFAIAASIGAFVQVDTMLNSKTGTGRTLSAASSKTSAVVR